MAADHGRLNSLTVRVARSGLWHPASPGVLGAAIFALLMLIVTILHWRELNGGQDAPMAVLSFYAWIIVYLVSPFAVFALWWRNRRAAGVARHRASTPLLHPGFRRGALTVAAGAIGLGGLMFVTPSAVMGQWPWDLSMLTARVIGCFTIQVGIGALILSQDLRWSTWRLLVQTSTLAIGLQFVGAIRVWDSFRSDSLATLVVIGLLSPGVGLAYLLTRMARLEGDALVGWSGAAGQSPEAQS